MIKLEIGAWDNLPHYAVVGSPTSFYVWINLKGGAPCWYVSGSSGSSGWISGKAAFKHHNKLREYIDKGMKQEFINLIIQLHKEYNGELLCH